MSQDQITSSEEYSDFNNDKITNSESVPTSPEGSIGKSTKGQSATLKKKAASTTSISESESSTPMNHMDADVMDESDDLQPATPLSSHSTPSQTPKLSDSKIPKSEKKKEKEKKEKKEKKASRTINFASGVSTSVPLTGERPKPNNHVSMEDDVLLAIFIILFEHDPDSKGMTVKQICDILIEKHPEMSKLSSKTSNLVSAKLNAYVKKVEKGDSAIHYALSRDWADTSPKRMVYVYRGILSPEYPAYVQKIIADLRKKEAANHGSSIDYTDTPNDQPDSANEYGSEDTEKRAKLSEKTDVRSQTPLTQDLSNIQSISPAGLQLDKSSPFGNGSIDFGIPQLSVPYAVAPVTASLNITMPMKNIDSNEYKSDGGNPLKSDFANGRSNQYLTTIPDSDDDDDVYNSMRADFDDDEENDRDDSEVSVYENHGYYRRGSDIVTERVPSGLTKRSKSISFVNKRSKSNSASSPSARDSHKRQNSMVSDSSSGESSKIVTAAAVTPRVPRKSFATPHATAAVNALRAVVFGSYGNSVSDHVSAITSSIMSDTSVEPSVSAKWLETVRSGFLNQDIDSPEDVSLAELETLFA